MSEILTILGLFCLVLGATPGNAVARIAGDANRDSVVNVADVVHGINYLSLAGPKPPKSKPG